MTRIAEALTFDDVLIKPAASEVLPAQVQTNTRIQGWYNHRNRRTHVLPLLN